MVIKENKKILTNRRGDVFLFLLIMIAIFISVTAIVMDYSNLYIKSKKVKYAINRAVKASTLQIKEDGNLANGIFLIDESIAQEKFELILAHNLGLDENTLEPLNKSIVVKAPIILEFAVENNTPNTYHSITLNKNFDVQNPSVITVLEFEVKGMLLKKKIRVAKLSSSQLTSSY